MRRIFVLLARALRFNEPVLLVGETGCGKTSVCQVFADVTSRRLHALNCHQNTETADLIGGLRPIRNRSTAQANVFHEVSSILEQVGYTPVEPEANARGLLNHISALLKEDLGEVTVSSLKGLQRRLLQTASIFEWSDGPLVEAMRHGDAFLLDEISLADDSVLERLNSVLEPARTIVLAERGGDNVESSTIRAANGFKLMATMNPGGDYGKKELSPALRNRFTEIWVPAVDSRLDLQLIVDSSWRYDIFRSYTNCLLDFTAWLQEKIDRSVCSLRDILSWVSFSNSVYSPDVDGHMQANGIFRHAAHLTFIDAFGSLPQLNSYSSHALQGLRVEAVNMLQQLAPCEDSNDLLIFVRDPSTAVQLGSFAIPKGPEELTVHNFSLRAPTTRENATRVLRACQLLKPILLEGSPGVGKTALITALANITGHRLCRINLSDQTDLIDLFGSDLPVENGQAGEFAWKDAEFLRAVQEGYWVLLDEMNLAPQAVLEGLNAILDHRGTVYIPELGRTFTRHPSFRIFAAQNPLQQGGGRKGLPKSFINRFTKVYMEDLTAEDLLIITRQLFPECDADMLRGMITYNHRLHQEVVVKHSFGRDGSPWEFNLRDVIRWGELLQSYPSSAQPMDCIRNIYLARFRLQSDRENARLLFEEVFHMSTSHLTSAPYPFLSPSHLRIGQFETSRGNAVLPLRPRCVLQSQLSALESIGTCISRSWLVILTGRRGTGKTEVLRTMANLTGNFLHEFSINSATDTMDIIGSYEQVDQRASTFRLARQVLLLVEDCLRHLQGSVTGCESYYELQRAIHPSISNVISSHQVIQSISKAMDDYDRLCVLEDEQVSRASRGDELRKQLESFKMDDSVGARFEWVDGPLVRALKEGSWLVLDGANICNPSVLDRLNSLCELNGALTLNEQGYVDGKVPVLRPHPNFRLFMTVDPHYGELSRAMRNRGIETVILGGFTPEDQRRLCDYLRFPEAEQTSIAITFSMYESIRRGIRSSSPPPFQENMWPSGICVDQDTASSFLITHANYFTSPPSSSRIENYALSHFLARAVVPNFIPFSLRFLHSLALKPHTDLTLLYDVLKEALSSSLSEVVSSLRDASTTLNNVSPRLVDYQPTDIYMCVENYPATSDTILSPTHRRVLQLLSLFVDVIVDKAETTKFLQKGIKGPDRTSESWERLHDIMVIVLQELQGVTSAVLYDFCQDPTADNKDDCEISIRLLHHASYLRSAAATTSFDHSALQLVSKWISDDLLGCHSRFLRLADAIRTLEDAISLSSGLGLSQIWSTFLVASVPNTQVTNLKCLEDALCCLNKSNGNRYEIRRDALQLMAMSVLPGSSSPKEQSTIAELIARLSQRVSDNQSTTPACKNDPCLVIAELYILCRSNRRISTQTVPLIHQLIDGACKNPESYLVRYIQYQHLAWASDEEVSLPTFSHLHVQWLEAIWIGSPRSVAVKGPDYLLQPIHLITTYDEYSLKSVPLLAIDDYEASLHRHSELTILRCATSGSRVQQLSWLFSSCVRMMCHCFRDSLPEEAIASLQGDWEDHMHSLRILLAACERSTNPAFLRALQHYVKPVVHRLLACHDSTASESSTLGWCWAALCRFILELFIPNNPVDPSSFVRYSFDFWRQEEDLLTQQQVLHLGLEHRTTANGSNSVLRYLDENLVIIREQINRYSADVPHRPDVARLHLFWSEIQQFLTQVLSPQKIDTLLLHLDSDDPSAPLREEVIQESISTFCQRLDMIYPDFQDIVVVVRLALLQMRLGLRLVRYSARTRSDPNVVVSAKLAEDLTSFPSVRSACLLATGVGISHTCIGASERIILNLSASAVKVSITGISDHLADVDAAYEQAFRLWRIDRNRTDALDKESQSLYRRNGVDHDANTEMELEEREFLELFPTFENALDEDAQLRPQSSKKEKLLADPSQLAQLLGIHYNLFELSNPFEVSFVSSSLCTFHDTRRVTLFSLLESNSASLPDTLDNRSLPLQFTLLQMYLSELKGPMSASFNFYSDPNLSEARKAVVVLDALKSRLDVLIQEWPDQIVLQHLKNRCESILALDFRCPIARILSALEQLLLQTDDWEMYAHRANNLQDHRQALTSLIIAWRRLELACWQTLLRSQSDVFAMQVSEYWFHLYEATVHGTLAATEDGSDALVDYLRQLAQLLDDFISSSPLGQFEPRMRLLLSFGTFASKVRTAKSGLQSSALERVELVITSTWRYYKLFSSRLSIYLEEQRSALDKEVEGFIKLASWKDINVQALKQSAQRTHHHLYKIIRKYREVLRQPVVDRLSPLFDASTEYQSTETTKTCPSFSLTTSVASIAEYSIPQGAPHLAGLAGTLQKFEGFIGNRVQVFLQRYQAQTIDEMTMDVITTSQSLASHVIPSNLSREQRGKHQKALLVRKRRAWSDLLKELRRLGLSANLKPEVLDQLRDVSWVRQQPIMPSTPVFASAIKGEVYFDKLRGALPSLRSTLSCHHSDVTTRELLRGITLLESGYSLALSSRAHLAQAIINFQTFYSTTKRLESLSQAEKLVMYDSAMLGNLKVLVRTLSETNHALDEISQGLETYSNLNHGYTITELIKSISRTCAETAVLRTRLVIILCEVEISQSSILLEDEHVLVHRVVHHLQILPGQLAEMSTREPTLQYLLRPLEQWVREQEVPTFLPSEPRSDVNAYDDASNVIDTLLVNVQMMLSHCSDVDKTTPAEETPDGFIREGLRVNVQFTNLLGISALMEKIRSNIVQLHHNSQSDVQSNLKRILPFLFRYVNFTQDQIISLSEWTKALFKLCFILSSIMHNISKQGFCVPPETDDAPGNDSTEAAGGVGLGEGEGTENISKEIEDESQVEGLKGDDENGAGQEHSDDKDAIEMGEDFGGDMNDVPDDGSEDEDSVSDEEEEPDEQVGDLDPSDPSAVDEKLWGDETGPPDSNEQDQTKEDRSNANNNDSDIAAKENQDDKAGDKKEQEPDKELGGEQKEDGDDEEKDDSFPDASGAPMDDHIPDADTLDLPEDMTLGEDIQEQAEGGEISDEDDMELDDNAEAPTNDENINDAPESMEEEELVEMPQQSGVDEGEEDETENNSEVQPDAVAQPDVLPGEGEPEAGDLDEGQGGSTERQPSGPSGEVKGDDEIKNKASEAEIEQLGSETDPTTSDQVGEDPMDAAMETSTRQHGQGTARENRDLAANPMRNLGDALKEIQQRFQEILEGDTPVQEPILQSDQPPEQIEYDVSDDVNHDMQALGPAGEEQVARLNDLKLSDHEPPKDDVGAPMDVDVPSTEQQETVKPMTSLHAEPSAEGMQEDIEGAIAQMERRKGQETKHEPTLPDPSHLKAEINMDDSDEVTFDSAEAELRTWQSDDYADGGAEHIWRIYEKLTHDLSYALCEQLRLILEPTLATRLKGDYRTGKRLNMKKIIPYIASDYTKDKIWLRRTRPSQREYQVLIALDDSRSMAESHSVHLAYETLALVTKALNRLEVGEVAVAKFGEAVDIIHGFEDGPFTDQEGTKVVNAFRFNQKATNVLSLVDTSLRVLEAARESRSMRSTSAADLWQLEIIISDGICQDHDGLRTVLRRAVGQRVMIVFIVIDSLHSVSSVENRASSDSAAQNSILSMNQVAYKMVDGRMELQMERYMDSFPFDYYVVLRNVEALPEVLSGTLRQFFERISEE